MPATLLTDEPLTLTNAPLQIVDAVENMGLSPLMVMLLLLAMYIVLGAIFDSIAAMVLTLPFVFPLVMQLGFDPIWWGIVMVMVIEIGMITPPIGINALIIKSMLPDSKLTEIYAGIVPFLLSDIVRLALVILFPALTLWLPTILDLPR